MADDKSKVVKPPTGNFAPLGALKEESQEAAKDRVEPRMWGIEVSGVSVRSMEPKKA